jgi:hypothetical protein
VCKKHTAFYLSIAAIQDKLMQQKIRTVVKRLKKLQHHKVDKTFTRLPYENLALTKNSTDRYTHPT